MTKSSSSFLRILLTIVVLVSIAAPFYNRLQLPESAEPSQQVSKNANNSTVDSCLAENGPQPFVLMSLGRSGSGSTWQVIGELTGMKTPSVELTGSSSSKSRKFFDLVAQKNNTANGQWILTWLCGLQKKYPNAGAVGFKWKPFDISRKHLESLQALRLASQTNPQIKFVRLRRNLLDVYVSRVKHHKSDISAHCVSKDCQNEAIKHKTEIEANTLIGNLQRLTDGEHKMDRMLVDLNVPHVQVKYEKLYYSDSPDEWIRILDFLQVGPKNLTLSNVHDAMKHLPTSTGHHRDSIDNYEQVVSVLNGSEFESLLHRQ